MKTAGDQHAFVLALRLGREYGTLFMKWPTKLSIGVAVGIIALLLIGFFFFAEIRELVEPVFEWIDDMGAWGRVWFVVLYMLLVVLMIPSFLLTLAGGFLFGVVEGSIYVIGAMMLGAAISFIVARWLLGEKIAHKFRGHPKLEGLSEGIGEEGFKIVMLCRFIPFFPAKISNYFFGLTPMGFLPFLAGNLVGIIPWTITNVYIGSLASNLARLGEHETSPLEWVLYGLGLFAAAGLAFFISRLARRSMEHTMKRREAASSDQ